MTTHVASAFIDSPAGNAMVTVIATAAVSAVGAIIKTMVDVARLVTAVKEISRDVKRMKGDADVMRWSEYGAMSRRGRRDMRRGGDGR